MRGAIDRPAAASIALGVVLLLGAMAAPGGPGPAGTGPADGPEGQSPPESNPPAVLLLGAMAAPGGPSPAGTGLGDGHEGQSPPESNPPAFSIFGLVESPGRYGWSDGITVGRAVAAAGGYARGGSRDELQIQRMVDGRLVSRAVTEDDPVRPDDVIMVRGRAVERPEPDPGQRKSTRGTTRVSGGALPPGDGG